MNKITRADAKKKGLKRFYNETPCTHGHDCERYTTNGNCVDCVKIYARKKREETVDTVITVENCEPTMERAVEIVENVKALFPGQWIVRDRYTRKEWGPFETRKVAQEAYRNLRLHIRGALIVTKK